MNFAVSASSKTRKATITWSIVWHCWSMIKEEFAKRILGLERFNGSEVSFCKMPQVACLSQLDGWQAVFGFTGQQP
ncbi:hypothetical protein AB3S75_028529 [Citrus x aurantiifolia]